MTTKRSFWKASMLAIAGAMIMAVCGNGQVMNDMETSCTPGTGSGDVTPAHVERTGTPPALEGSTDGESTGGMVTRVSGTVGFAGEYMAQSQGGFQMGQIAGPSPASLGDDIRVGINEMNLEWFHSMVCDSNGTMWAAWLEDEFVSDYIQVYTSEDGGETWDAFAFLLNTSADLKHPNIAVGEGMNGDTVLLAYIVDDGSSQPYPEVATTPMSGPSFTIQTVPHHGGWEAYAKPVIHTDSYKYPQWYAYLTCEGIYNSAVNNINVCFWRCTDGGATWSSMVVSYGDFDTDEWIDPDLAYGCTMNRLFLTVYHANDSTIQMMTSDDEGQSWTTSSTIFNLSPIPSHPVDPEIEAAVNEDNVMICCTKSHNLNDNIGQGYSKDAGATWSPLYSLDLRLQDEFAASLTANEGGGSFHVAFTSGQDHSVFYSHRPQDMSSLWSVLVTVDDERMAGSHDDFSKKGIASDWDTDTACIIWSDSRDTGSVSDMDTFSDRTNNTGIMLDNTVIPEMTGASINFTLNAGPAKAGRNYILLGSVSGQSPGTLLPGGYAVLPINWDILTDVMMELINGPAFQNFLGTLDSNGMATATLNAPPLPGFAFVPLFFAFCINSPFNYASNCQIIWIVP